MAASFAALTLIAFVAPPAAGDALPPPPPLECARDADCNGCDLCVGATASAKGACTTPGQGVPGCMCNADCATGGTLSCALSADKPLCGGTCTTLPAARELVCGAGDDVVKLEAFPGATTLEAGPAAHVIAGETIGVDSATGTGP